MALSSSLEDYIEAIYTIIEENHAVRAKDISHRLGVKSSSVTGALRILSDKDLINYEPYGVITLTKSGQEVAQGVFKKHETITEFFVKILGIEADCAEDNACRMEHVISEVILERMRDMLDFVESENVGREFMNSFSALYSPEPIKAEGNTIFSSEKD